MEPDKTNADYCRAWRKKVQADPARLAYRREKDRARTQRLRKRKRVSGISTVEEPVVTSKVKAISREDARMLYEERAAIREVDGGLSRKEAEKAALEDLRELTFVPEGDLSLEDLLG